jgi:MFS superfamily sulfate permease-like transporter
MSFNARSDLIAGISVAGLMIPEAVAYAGIAGLPPARAILALIVGGLAYAALGRSRFAIIAPTSSSAAILAAALATLPDDANAKSLMATGIVVIVGLLFGLVAVLKLGGILAFIARPVLRGFAFGLAITIIIRQLPVLLGLPVHATSIVALLGALAVNIAAVNGLSLAIGIIGLTTILLLRRAGRLPGALVVLGAGVALSFVVDLPGHHVALVGPLTLALNPVVMPEFDYSIWSRLVQLALPLTLILFAESWGTMRALALRHGEQLSATRELAALAGANLASALAQGMPVGAGFSAGSASEAAGAASRLTGVVGAISVAGVVLFAAALVARIPEPVLAAVVIAALTHALSLAPLTRLFAINRDQWVALVAALAVIGFGALNGMLVAIALSLGTLLHRLASPSLSQLGRLGESHDYVDLARHRDAAGVPSIAIFRPNAPLFFANADACLGQIADAARRYPSGTTIILSLEESDDLDSSAVEAIAELDKALSTDRMALHLARAHDRVRVLLAVSGLTILAKQASFSVADAVDFVQKSGENK